jgi:hypothetical protein
LRRKNLLQRTSGRSSRGFGISQRSPTHSRTSTASFLRSLASSGPSPASFDGCSSPSSTTSGESQGTEQVEPARASPGEFEQEVEKAGRDIGQKPRERPIPLVPSRLPVDLILDSICLVF